jgi:ABC-type enterochelin transport system permease subunit
MPRRAVRLVFRVAGWLLTPLVLTTAAAIGAAIGLVFAPRFPPQTALIITVACAFVAAVIGLMLWVRLLRRSPRLRETFAVTSEGVPESALVEQLMHPDEPKVEGKP